MKLLGNMIVFSSSEYKQLSDRLSYLTEEHEQDFKNLNIMYNKLCEYKKHLRVANKNTKKAKDKIKRLNNIINELEKYLNEQIQKSWEIEEQCYENIESKLQELKGSDK